MNICLACIALISFTVLAGAPATGRSGVRSPETVARLRLALTRRASNDAPLRDMLQPVKRLKSLSPRRIAVEPIHKEFADDCGPTCGCMRIRRMTQIRLFQRRMRVVQVLAIVMSGSMIGFFLSSRGLRISDLTIICAHAFTICLGNSLGLLKLQRMINEK